MHNLDLILTLTGGLAAALILGYITQRLGLSPILGYLAAGVVVGPHTPGFVANQSMAEQFAEVGVILLMFGVGLHFHLEELLAVRKVAVPGAVGQSLAATALGTIVGVSVGWSWEAGLVFGLAISVASTVVLLRVLADNRDLHTPAGHIAVGWLVVEDLLTVVVLVILPAIWGPEARSAGPHSHATHAAAAEHPGAAPAELAHKPPTLPAATAGDSATAATHAPAATAGDSATGPAQEAGMSLPLVLLIAGAKMAALVLFTFVVGGRVIPWLLEKVAATHSRELFTLTVLVTALGIAVGSAKVFGVSMALGAFLAGMIVGRSEFSLRAAAEALPMRDAFAVLFFVSVGMLFDFHELFRMPGLIAATCGVILIGKPAAAFAIVMLLRYPLRTALAVAVALAQIGEFSFILGSMGRELGVLPAAATSALVASAIVSITLNPLLYRTIGPMEAWLKQRFPQLDAGARRPAVDVGHHDPDSPRSPHRAVVVGYGPVGRTLTRLLAENGIEPCVIEMNLATVRRLRESGIKAVYGDASKPDTLLGAGLEGARSLILSSSLMSDTAEVIRRAKEIDPKVRVLARSAYVRDLAELKSAGASAAFSGEGETALALIEAVLRPLGATAEQVDRERDRFRAEILDGTHEIPLNPEPAAPVPGATEVPPAPHETPLTEPAADVEPPRK